MRRKTRKFILCMPEQNRSYLRAYILHVEKLINEQSAADHKLNIQTPHQPITSLMKRGDRVRMGDVILALQDFPSAGQNSFRNDVITAHEMRGGVRIYYSSLSVPFWEWILLHRDIQEERGELMETVANTFQIPCDEVNSEDGIDRVLQQIDLEDVLRMASAAPTDELDKLVDGDTFIPVSMNSILALLVGKTYPEDTDE